jgi:PKHD-type hydroxylase
MNNLNSQNLYWGFVDGVTKEDCEYIIGLGKQKKFNLATIGTIGKERDVSKNPLNKKEKQIVKKTRDSDVVFLNEPRVYEIIWHFLNIANKNAGWNFQVDFTEHVQLTKYTKNKFYDWHQDSWELPYQNTNEEGKDGKIRKLSCVVLLSDPKDFKGGDLEFYQYNPALKDNIVKCDMLKKQGSFIVFPSYLWHRVLPVTKGTRYSLVAWNCGLPWN